MFRITAAALTAAILAVSGPATAASGWILSGSPEQPILNVDWCQAKKQQGCAAISVNDVLDEKKITPDSYVTVKVKNFNFVRYDLQVNTKDAKDPDLSAIQAATQAIPLLNIFNSLPDGKPKSGNNKFGIFDEPGDNTRFIEAGKKVEKALGELDASVKNLRNVSGESFLTASDLDELKCFVVAGCTQQTLQSHVDSLNAAMNELVGALTTFPRFVEGNKVLYAEIKGKSDKASQTVEELSRRTKQSIEGRTFHIGSRDLGTKVTVVLSPMSIAATPTPGDIPQSHSYEVQRQWRASYHIGYVMSWLRDDDFQLVSGAGTAGAYDHIRQDSRTDRFAFFITYHLGSSNAGVSLGTDLKDAGTRFYIGGSYLFRIPGSGLLGSLDQRILLNAGVATASLRRGKDDLDIAGQDLFDSVRVEREWRPYVGITFKVY
jgi:hypothetical protein